MDKELTQEQIGKLNAEFKKAWPKLTDSDLVIYKSTSNREKFIANVAEKQGVDKAAVEKSLKEIEASCGCVVTTKAA
jgi:predicted transcriptional regulator